MMSILSYALAASAAAVVLLSGVALFEVAQHESDEAVSAVSSLQTDDEHAVTTVTAATMGPRLSPSPAARTTAAPAVLYSQSPDPQPTSSSSTLESAPGGAPEFPPGSFPAPEVHVILLMPAEAAAPAAPSVSLEPAPPPSVPPAPPRPVSTIVPAGVTTSAPAGVSTSPPAGVSTSPPAGVVTDQVPSEAYYP